MTKSLNGERILVTRPVHQAENLCQLIQQKGGIALRYPTLEIVSFNEQNLATFLVKKLSKAHWIIFTSVNAVNFALKGNSGKIRQFAKVSIVAIGKATAQALEASGINVNLVPEEGFNSEALLAMPEMQKIEGSEILIVRGQGGREKLAKELTARGAIVEYLEVYKRVIPDHDNTEINDLLDSDNLTAIVLTSGEALENLLAMIDIKYQMALKTIPLVVISDRIKGLAVGMGFNRVAVSANPSDEAIINTIMTAINEDKCG